MLFTTICCPLPNTRDLWRASPFLDSVCITRSFSGAIFLPTETLLPSTLFSLRQDPQTPVSARRIMGDLLTCSCTAHFLSFLSASPQLQREAGFYIMPSIKGFPQRLCSLPERNVASFRVISFHCHQLWQYHSLFFFSSVTSLVTLICTKACTVSLEKNRRTHFDVHSWCLSRPGWGSQRKAFYLSIGHDFSVCELL